jgi:hypothetical protein
MVQFNSNPNDSIIEDPAPESEATKRARRKLNVILNTEQKNITPNSLRAASARVLHQHSHGNPTRIILTDKSITAFDENEHSADPTSEHVKALRKQLKKESSSTPPPSSPSLIGRMKKND